MVWKVVDCGHSSVILKNKSVDRVWSTRFTFLKIMFDFQSFQICFVDNIRIFVFENFLAFWYAIFNPYDIFDEDTDSNQILIIQIRF